MARKALRVRSLEDIIVQIPQNNPRVAVRRCNLIQQRPDERRLVLEAQQNISFILQAKMIDALEYYFLSVLVPGTASVKKHSDAACGRFRNARCEPDTIL